MASHSSASSATLDGLDFPDLSIDDSKDLSLAIRNRDVGQNPAAAQDLATLHLLQTLVSSDITIAQDELALEREKLNERRLEREFKERQWEREQGGHSTSAR